MSFIFYIFNDLLNTNLKKIINYIINGYQQKINILLKMWVDKCHIPLGKNFFN